jgi:Tfp pilus assembly protein PilF
MRCELAAITALFAFVSVSPAISASGYELTGRIEPPARVAVSLSGATTPFQGSTLSGADGRFVFHKLSPGIYTLVVSTAARGKVVQTIDLSAGTVDRKGRLDVLVKIEPGRLESDGGVSTGATVSATVLSTPERAAKEYDEALRCLNRRDSACAATHLQTAVDIAPRFSAAWNQLGIIAYQTKRYSDAESHFRRALEASPDSFEPLVNLGGVLLNLARPREALTYNQRAASRAPNDALANSQLGLTYFQLGNGTEAERFLRIAVSLDPAHFSYPQLTLAKIYAQRGDRPAALEQLRDFLTRHPDAPVAPAVRRNIARLSSPN